MSRSSSTSFNGAGVPTRVDLEDPEADGGGVPQPSGNASSRSSKWPGMVDASYQAGKRAIESDPLVRCSCSQLKGRLVRKAFGGQKRRTRRRVERTADEAEG